MFNFRLPFYPIRTLKGLFLSAGIIISSGVLSEVLFIKKAYSYPSLLEFRWENSTGYKKLYYSQSSKEKRDRSTYYLVLRPNDRKTAILKLNITVPDYFDANISPKKLSLCRVTLGGMLSRTKCIEKIPAVFEINEAQTSIDVFPDKPIPVGESYAVVMKIFNPNQSGMFQFNALGQPPGDIPVSRYLGSWSIDIN